ncbi:MAG: hypothetical protein J6Z26_07695 [Bacteroidales bacterium]|nr:hypothetical protein [Bacteroidales bacterium]
MGRTVTREAWANARWIGMKKSPVDFSIARKGGEFVFILRYAIETFTECFFIFQEKKEIQRGITIVNRDLYLKRKKIDYTELSVFLLQKKNLPFGKKIVILQNVCGTVLF